MSNKARVAKECDRINRVERNVAEANIDSNSFFQKIHGNLLISGIYADNTELITDAVSVYSRKDNIPTIVLTTHPGVPDRLSSMQRNGIIDRVINSYPMDRNYNPMLGLSKRKIMEVFRYMINRGGYSSVGNEIMIYATAIMNVVEKAYPICLPAIVKLLRNDDDAIANFALSKGLGNVVADNIRSQHMAGIQFRRILEEIEESFSGIYETETESYFSIKNGIRSNVRAMTIYAASSNQALMNKYFREEIGEALDTVSRIRVILDEMTFEDAEDELLKFLFQKKRTGQVELIFFTKNAGESFHNETLDFDNAVMFRHGNDVICDEVSKRLFGSYSHHYPVVAAGAPPSMLFTLKKTVHWAVSHEELPRVRYKHFRRRQTFGNAEIDMLAIKHSASNTVYMVPVSSFIPLSNRAGLIPA